jgi:peptidoglycan hydrolase-like protein with peptidoglycan-binding domain
LNQLGYPLGRPDGALGPATRKAIDKFKSDRKMSGTDAEVFQLIQAEYKNKFPGMQTTYNDPSYSEKPVTASKRR